MKLTLKQQWRPRPLSSFLGCLDIKMGVTIVLLFAVLNKVAGIYGLVALFSGASFAQLSLYLYSALALLAFAWGLKVISEEDPKRTFYFAHLFFVDHILSTAWTVFFAVVWWLYTPHDGRRIANSAAQEALMKGGAGHNMTEEERTRAALMIWNKEKGTAAALIVVGWCLKIYFAILLYSYAIHLRKGSYRSLPHSSSTASPSSYHALNARYGGYPDDTVLGDGDEDDFDEVYRIPASSSSSAPAKTPGTGSSITSFADFVSAPGRGRRFRGSIGSISGVAGAGSSTPKNGHFPRGSVSGVGVGGVPMEDVEEETLFDSDELGGGGSASGHSKFGTEESTSVSSREDGDGRGYGRYSNSAAERAKS